MGRAIGPNERPTIIAALDRATADSKPRYVYRSQGDRFAYGPLQPRSGSFWEVLPSGELYAWLWDAGKYTRIKVA